MELRPSSELGRRHPAVVAAWERAWERFTPFLAFPPAVRKIIYTTNAIESLNYQLRKIIKNRGHFPNDDAVIKLLWLAIRDIEDKRARARAKEKGVPREPAQSRRPAGRRRRRPRLAARPRRAGHGLPRPASPTAPL
ncbi:MAG: transposase [Geodermatophilaceae bacterium]